MFLARITFGTDGGLPQERETLEEATQSYLAALLKNGQISGKYLFAWHNATLVAYARVPRPDALAKQHHSEWTKADLDSLVETFGQPPACEIIDENVPKRFPSWKKSTFFYLYSAGLDEVAPICCGDTGHPIPPYLLPLSQQTCEDLHFGSRSYGHHESIWLDSAALEIPAYKQIADPTSDLSVRGRELCAAVERAVKIPTFYYMHRYWGRNDGEAVRPCPVCGGKWHSSHNSTGQQAFHQFHFRCKRCRLVSSHADSFEDERHARIGEYKTTKN